MTPEEHARQYFSRDALAEALGFRLVAASTGFARVELPEARQHFNGIGTLHGGLIMTCADLAFAAACNSYPEVAAGVSVNVAFLTVARRGRVYAEATEARRGRRLTHYDLRVMDSEDRLIASGSGTAFIQESAATS